MTPEQESKSRDFFQKQWRRPLHRFGKTIMPIVVAAIGVFGLFFALMTVISLFIKENDPQQIFFHTLISVGGGTLIAVAIHYSHPHRHSRFIPILLRKKK